MTFFRVAPPALVLSLCGLAAGACGYPEVYKEAPRDIAADTIAEAVCAGATSCCDDLGYDSPSDRCRATMRNALMEQIILAEDEQREVRFQAIEPCVRAFEAAIASASNCQYLPVAQDVLALCPDLFTAIPEGARLPGEACSGTDDCASPSEPGRRECIGNGYGSGTCSWYLSRPIGAECADEPEKVVFCSPGLTCAPSPRGQLFCAPPPGYGEACALFGDSCQEGLVCTDFGGGVVTCDVMPPGDANPVVENLLRTPLQALCE